MVDRRDIKIKLVFYRTLFSQSGASLTMGSLASYLRSHDFDVNLCFLERDGIHNAERILDVRSKNNVIIAKPNFKDFEELFLILGEIKSQKAVDRIFLCGPYASLNALSIMKNLPWLDGIIMGETEETTLELVKSFSGKRMKFYAKCPGGTWRDPGTGKVAESIPRLSKLTLNELPFPARDIEKREEGNYVNIEASRGCTFDCSFCHIPLMLDFNGKRGAIDIRDPKLVVDEIEYLNKKLGKTLFIFNDDCFWRSPDDDKRILEFCSELKKRKLDIKFYVYFRCNPFIGERLLGELSKVGLVRVFLGIENASSRSQRVFNKPIKQYSFENIKKILDCYDINVHIGYITIEPYSTINDIMLNIDYLFKIKKLFRLGVIIEPVRIVPGTKLHSKLVSDGLMSPNLEYHEIMYGYRFANQKVGEILAGFRSMFLENLYPASYDFEYRCTAGELLRTLAERLDVKFKELLKEDYQEFNRLKLRAMKILFSYFKSSIILIKSGTNAGQVSSYNRYKKFITEFSKASIAIEVKYADIVSKLKQHGGERAMKEIYSGLDRI